jgi:hypothetical protein
VSNQWFPGMNGQEPASRCKDIAGGHLSVFAESEPIRARFNANGWDLDSLLDPQVTAQFTYGQSNRLAGR